MVKTVNDAIGRITGFLGHVGAFLISLLAILLVYDVIMRYVFNNPADWVLDLVQLLQVAMAFLTISYVHKIGGHINMNILTQFTSNKGRRWLSIASNSLTMIGSGWMGYLSWPLFTRSYRIHEAAYAIDIPLYPWKLLVPLCFSLMSLQCLVMTIENIMSSPDQFVAGKGEE